MAGESLAPFCGWPGVRFPRLRGALGRTRSAEFPAIITRPTAMADRVLHRAGLRGHRIHPGRPARPSASARPGRRHGPPVFVLLPRPPGRVPTVTTRVCATTCMPFPPPRHRNTATRHRNKALPIRDTYTAIHALTRIYITDPKGRIGVWLLRVFTRGPAKGRAAVGRIMD